MKKQELIESIYIDANLLVKDGIFWGRNISWNASPDYKNKVDKVIAGNNEDGSIFIVDRNYGSPYVDTYVRGGIAWNGSKGNTVAWASKKSSDDLLCRSINQLNEVRELIGIEIPKPSLYSLFYREQHSAAMSILENFLYCMVLREMIFDRDTLVNNIRCFDYESDYLSLGKCVKNAKTDHELYILLVDKITRIVYHNFEKVTLLYKIIFDIDISEIITVVNKEVIKRNNIVHRNGAELNGEPMIMQKEHVIFFINNVQKAITDIWNLIKNNTKTNQR